MTVSRRMTPLLTLAVTVVGAMVLAQLASALHPRPKSASPIRVSLVPAYKPCTSPNRTHGPPLTFDACSPPVQTSNYVTVGTPDANGAAAKSIGYVRLAVIPPQCCPQQDVSLTGSITDVRCSPGAGTCGGANAVGGPDYTGELQMNATIRITDHWNSTSPGGGTDPATVVDIPFPANMACAGTADTSIGATCNFSSAPVGIGAPSPNVDRAVVELTQIEVLDGGADGAMATTPNTLFAVQGIFIP